MSKLSNIEAAKVFSEISEANTKLGEVLRKEDGRTVETMLAQLHSTVALGIARILLQLAEQGRE